MYPFNGPSAIFPDVVELLQRFLDVADNGDMKHMLRIIAVKSDLEIPCHFFPNLPQELAQFLSLCVHRAQAEFHAFNQLTDREAEVMTMLAAGRSNLEVSTGLGMAERTVRDHIENMQYKLGVSGRGKLVARAFGLDVLCSTPAETPVL